MNAYFSNMFKILQTSLEWLDAWEMRVQEGSIKSEEFLTVDTARGLRLSLRSTMDLCTSLISDYKFEYLLSGKVNQDNLEVTFN